MKKILFTFLAIVLLFASSTTSALTQTERDALIQTLLQQIAVLQNQINAILSARGDGVANQSLAAAPQLTRNLYLGSRGDDVVSTQRFLQSTGDFTYGEITGYYGNATAEAVQRYQCRAMSICSGTQDGNGYGVVGPATRSSFMMKYGTSSTMATVPMLPPVDPHISGLPLSPTQPPNFVTPARLSCTFADHELTNGSFVLAYQADTVPAGQDCMSEVRTCSNGVLSGKYQYGSCTIGAAPLVTTADPEAFAINTRRNPVAMCTRLSSATPSNRPVFTDVDVATTTVSDMNVDGVVNERDVQLAMDTASNAYIASARTKTQLVALPTSISILVLSHRLTIPSGVILTGSGSQRLTPGTSFTDAYLAAIANNSTGAGIHGVVIDTATRTTAGGLYVGDGSRNVFVYDNTFIDEPNNIATGSGTGIYMVDLGPGSSNVFIDGNTFNHVPQGIASRIGDVTSIRITHNHFTNWREHAVFFINRLASSDISVNWNDIREPKIGRVRQPIAFQTGVNEALFQRVNASYNTIYSPNVPHIMERYTPDGSTTPVTNSMSNNATADVISLHATDGFQVVGNCIFNAGEVGITIAVKSKNGTVANNYIEGADTSAIAIGSSPLNNGTSGRPNWVTTNVNVLNNIIIDPARNRANDLLAWARSGIGFTNSSGNYSNGNRITETTVRYNQTGETATLYAGIFDKASTGNTRGTLNVVQSPNSAVLPYVTEP